MRADESSAAVRRTREAALSAAALVACSNVVTFMPLAEPPRQPQPRLPDDVDVFITKAPAAPYVVVGLLQSGGGWASELEMVSVLKHEGGKRGCEGVLLALNQATSQGSV